jgi:hypothetical protein
MATTIGTKTEAEADKAKPGRRRELDVMGMVVVMGLVIFHSAQIFNYADFYVKNEPPNMEHLSQLLATVFIAFAGLWGMPLMFLIAGIAIYYSLRKRTTAEFISERFRRLFMPLVVGTVLLVPIQVYTKLKSDPTYDESYGQFLMRFFNVRLSLDFPRFISGAPPDELFETGHLYFLNYLLAFTLLLLPLWLYLKRPEGQRKARKLVDILVLPWAIFLLALPIAAVEAALGTEYAGGWNRYAYIPFIIYGFLMAVDRRMGDTLRREWKKALLLGAVFFPIYIATAYMLEAAIQFDAQTDYSLSHVLFRFLKGLAGWFWVVAVMGLVLHLSHSRAASKKRKMGSTSGDEQDSQQRTTSAKASFSGRLAQYAGEAQLPFYVLHMTPIVLIGFFVVQWEANALLKFLLIVLSALIVTLLVYDIGVRRTTPTRLLFGLKPKESREKMPLPELDGSEKDAKLADR